MSKILIVGSASGLGSSLATSLLQNSEHSVVSVDDLRAERNLHNMQFALSHRKGDRHRFHLTSMADQHLCKSIFKTEEPDVVIFCKTPEPKSYHISLVNCIQESMASNKKFIYVANEFYDQFSNDQIKFGLEICDSPSVREHTSVLNMCHLFGPRQGANHPLTRIMCSILDGTSPPMLQEECIEWLYVKDAVAAIEQMILEPTGAKHTLRSGLEASETDIFMYLTHLPHSRESGLGIESAHSSSLGEWKPKHRLASAIEHTISWYSINQWARN